MAAAEIPPRVCNTPASPFPEVQNGQFRFKDLPLEIRNQVYDILIDIKYLVTPRRCDCTPNRWAIFGVDRQINEEVTRVFRDCVEIVLPVHARILGVKTYGQVFEARVARLLFRHITLQVSRGSVGHQIDAFDTLEKYLLEVVVPTSTHRPKHHGGKRWITIDIDKSFWRRAASKALSLHTTEVQVFNQTLRSWERCLKVMKNRHCDYDFVWTVKSPKASPNSGSIEGQIKKACEENGFKYEAGNLEQYDWAYRPRVMRRLLAAIGDGNDEEG